MRRSEVVPEHGVIGVGRRRDTRETAHGCADQGISLQTPVIVKYRDEKTDVATALEGWLR